jgi:hypothetical protein
MRKLLLSIGFLVTVNLATGTDLYVTYTQGLYSASASFVMSGSNWSSRWRTWQTLRM